ncbi:hypothetical protein ACTHQ4_02390 [Alkalicoccobacillus gibsonii]|uniref:hypothetical protein n=1 Tax=Alkalicoccobacillus gibsonii TaxID=79881 RepID=UPI003F7B943D
MAAKAAKIKIRITGVQIDYDEENIDVQQVDVSFNTTDPEGKVFTNGRISITGAQYQANSGLDNLSVLVRAALVDKFRYEESNDK